MRKKDNARARLTKKLFREAYFESLKAKGNYENVTITEVCERAELNRTTFYYFYKNCSDLLEKLEDGEIEEMKDIFSSSTEPFSPDNAEKIADVLERNADLNTACTNGIIGEGLKNKINDTVREVCLSSWKEPLTKSNSNKAEMISITVSLAFYELLFSHHGKYTVKDTFALLSEMLG